MKEEAGVYVCRLYQFRDRCGLPGIGSLCMFPSPVSAWQETTVTSAPIPDRILLKKTYATFRLTGHHRIAEDFRNILPVLKQIKGMK